MDKRKYITLLDELKTLPAPGTVLHTPDNKNYKLLGYNIGVDGYGEACIEACIESPKNPAVELEWTLDEVKQCTWEKFKDETNL